MRRDYWDLDQIIAEAESVTAKVDKGKCTYHANHLKDGDCKTKYCQILVEFVCVGSH